MAARERPTDQNPYSPPRDDLAPAPAVEALGPGPGPRGIGGWLILPMLGLLFTPIKVLREMNAFRGLLEPGTWAALTTPGGAAYHLLWGPTIIFELIANTAYVAFTVLVLVLFFRRSRRVPRLMMIWLAAPIAVQAIDLVLTAQIPALASSSDAASMTDLMRSFLGAAIWIPYFHNSRRVKNTFVN